MNCPKCGGEAEVTGVKPVRIPPQQGGGWDTVTCYDCPVCGEVTE